MLNLAHVMVCMLGAVMEPTDISTLKYILI